MKQNRQFWALIAVSGALVGVLGGVAVYGLSEAAEDALITTHCITGQTRVVESNKTREFHVLWDESCPK